MRIAALLKTHWFLFLLPCYFTSYPTVSQVKPATIKGTVTDSTTSAPLAYVTIVVLDKEEKQTIKHVLSSESGTFKLTGLAPKAYQLILSYVGYKTKTINISDLSSPTLDLGKVQLSPVATLLEEVQVTTQRPLLEQGADKLIYNVENDPEQYTLNTLDMLRKVPYITTDADDNLLLNGKGNYQVLVNGKRSALITGNPRDVLMSLPASSIKKIEVITVPSARYEAEGIGGIINIITHKKSISGYNGTLNLAGNSPGGYHAGGTLSATMGKFGVSGSYRHSYATSPGSSSNLLRNDLIRQMRLEQTTESNNSSRSQHVTSELSYQPDNRHSFTANYSYNSNGSTNNFKQQALQFNEADVLTEAYTNITTTESAGTGQDASLQYQFSPKENEEQLLSVSVNLTDNANNGNGNYRLQPILNYTGSENSTLNLYHARNHTLQADYVQPLGRQTLELGIRSDQEKNSSDYEYRTKDPETGIFKPDTALSNNFGYKQTINAAYASVNLKHKNWGLRSGIRVEDTRLNAAFVSSGTSARQRYQNIFPSITLSRAFKKGNTLKFSYNQRIERPGLYYLDPFVDKSDPLNIFFGNPELKPATSHTLQFDFDSFFGSSFVNASLSHSFTNNTIQEFTVLGSDSVARTTFGNIGKSRNYSFTLSGNTTLFRKLNISLNSGASYLVFNSRQEGNLQNSEGFSYYVQGNTNYRFGKNWRASGNLGYSSPNILLQGRSGGYTWSSLSVNKDFLKNNKASISLAVRSPFQEKRRATTELTNPAFYQRRETDTRIRQFSLSLTYRFGKLK
ncbi:TonB-dependent receptor [Pontibacter sp. Tf4]|uniref:TonB-dependent receptor domain-containing protein n=1 Tax=Pontibacter sp. Tf4 TaxID=2761620 RepID=UPI0016284EC0|nr:outer membrane beta-barrel family protein [Pontibacter sp. Tf4]MBB6612740.1 TonB-dependent receptor [Pontibacter sp. Tf4]